jgi:hypothetical protein
VSQPAHCPGNVLRGGQTLQGVQLQTATTAAAAAALLSSLRVRHHAGTMMVASDRPATASVIHELGRSKRVTISLSATHSATEAHACGQTYCTPPPPRGGDTTYLSCRLGCGLVLADVP